MKLAKILKLVGAIGVMGAPSITSAFAVECPSWLPSQMCGAGGGAIDMQAIVKIVLYILIIAAVLWALWNVIQAGLMYSGAGEDAEKKKKAMQKIVAAIVGLIIVIVSFTVLSLIGKWFGPIAKYVGPPCTADDDRSGAPDKSTQYGILLRKGTGPGGNGGTGGNFGCKDVTGEYVCVNPDPKDGKFENAAIDCSVNL